MTKKILFVEDDSAILSTAAEFLTIEGFEVITAENGQIGLALAKQHLPDLIVSDIMMPMLNGHELLHELRQESTTSAIPLIFLSAKSDPPEVRQGMTSGADDYITKPFALSELLSAIHTRIERQTLLNRLSEQKLDDLRSTLVVTLPHELRTPLSSIMGYADLLVADADTGQIDAAQVAEMAKAISKASHRLRRLIENYLTYAQTEISRTNPPTRQERHKQATQHPHLIVKDQATLTGTRAGRAPDLLTSVVEVPGVLIAQHYLEKIVQELLDNAFKFSKAGMPVQLDLSTTDTHCILSITNSGRGMSRAQINNIGAYMQFDRKLHEQQGSGLGLMIVKNLVELHGGALTIESVPDLQTSVSVVLPLAPDALINP